MLSNILLVMNETKNESTTNAVSSVYPKKKHVLAIGRGCGLRHTKVGVCSCDASPSIT